LGDAVLVNPFDIEQMADGLYAGLTMPAEEQERRMRRMRAQVDDHNIYRWAGMLLSAIGKLVPEPAAPSGSQSGTIPVAAAIARDGFAPATGTVAG
jgi:trehalose 6-phosphate synthase